VLLLSAPAFVVAAKAVKGLGRRLWQALVGVAAVLRRLAAPTPSNASVLLRPLLPRLLLLLHLVLVRTRRRLRLAVRSRTPLKAAPANSQSEPATTCPRGRGGCGATGGLLLLLEVGVVVLQMVLVPWSFVSMLKLPLVLVNVAVALSTEVRAVIFVGVMVTARFTRIMRSLVDAVAPLVGRLLLPLLHGRLAVVSRELWLTPRGSALVRLLLFFERG